MKLLVISDTHTNSINRLPMSVQDMAKKVDAIIHAGDVVGYKVIHDLLHINPNVYAVKGNMDPALGDDYLPKKRVLTFKDIKIGVSHGEGSPFGIENRLLYLFENDNVDLIIFGHTHAPFWGEINGIRFLNPGSPTDKREQPFPTYAILTIEEGTFDAEIIRV
ncbi:MAG: metallophosphoesterase [Denitrovibrio sp.]|nr:MAG: metallophosphoesterase [Denitrovibrio sp.]